MKSTRTLALAAERLAELSGTDLGAVAAAAPPDYSWYCITGGMCQDSRLICS